MSESRLYEIDNAHAGSRQALEDYLRDQENTFNSEVTGWALKSVPGNPGNGYNCFIWRHNPKLKQPSDLTVATFSGSQSAAYEQAVQIARNATPIALGTAIVGGNRTNIFLYRPGRTLKYEGKMSTFGGPNDHGMREDEGLAIVGSDNFHNVVSKHTLILEGTPLFLAHQNAGQKPLGRNLNPDAFYVACRWDYKLDISRADLVNCDIFVTNPLNGRTLKAVATDWGPHMRTGRSADLSPGLARALDLRTDDLCIVSVSGPGIKPLTAPSNPGTITPTEGATNLKVYSQSELEQRFGRITPVQENGDGSFQIQNPNFLSNIVEADLSSLVGVKGIPTDGQVKCHVLIKPSLEAAVAEVISSGLKGSILTWDGLFVPRHILWNQNRGFSTHSWGIAFDINAKWNGYGSRPAPEGTHGSILPLVTIFERHGFIWGGYWKTPDGMHFQYGR